jgi:hypothetical protein
MGSIEQCKEDSRQNEELALEISKVSSICEKVTVAISEVELDGKLLEILTDINEAVKGISKVQAGIVSKKSAPVSVSVHSEVNNDRESSNMVSLGNVAKKQRQIVLPEHNRSEQLRAQIDQAEQEEDRAMSKFREAVKVAENSTLIFNLDMGRVPIMNRDTMRTKATLALTSMAAKLEPGNKTSVPSEDTLAVIDDILGVTTGMEFFGRITKSYQNKKRRCKWLFLHGLGPV